MPYHFAKGQLDQYLEYKEEMAKQMKSKTKGK